MSNNNNNNYVVPGAQQGLYNMKHEVASQLGINLKNGYNGDLTAKQAGSIGGEMVKRMIQQYEQNMNG